jgi:ABC-type Fe3+ transport system permease subunit
MKFLAEIFQDIDGSYSSKRTAFFVLLMLFVVIAVAMFFRAVPKDAVPLMQGTQDKLTELIKWIGGFIVGEQASKFAPKDK